MNPPDDSHAVVGALRPAGGPHLNNPDSTTGHSGPPIAPTTNAGRSIGPAQGGPPTVVVADDEAHIRLIVADRLRTDGYTVVEARDGEEAFELITAQPPNAIVTDLQMPYMNGLELCTRLASDPRTADIPAILLTARGHIVEPSQLGRSVIRKTIAKPFSAKALSEAVGLMVKGGAGAPGREAGPFRRALPTIPPPLTGEAA